VNFKEKGYVVFYSPKEIAYGYQWREEIRKNIEKCDIFLVIATYGTIESEEVAQEIYKAKLQENINSV
jgi:glutamate racemase